MKADFTAKASRNGIICKFSCSVLVSDTKVSAVGFSIHFEDTVMQPAPPQSWASFNLKNRPPESSQIDPPKVLRSIPPQIQSNYDW